jgi:hypothetical protein
MQQIFDVFVKCPLPESRGGATQKRRDYIYFQGIVKPTSVSVSRLDALRIKYDD